MTPGNDDARTEGGGGTIVVAVDASPLSLAGLTLAARLGRRWRVPVRAVCVEDSTIARLAGHPGVIALCPLTARARPLALAPRTIAAALAGQRRAAAAAVDAVRRHLADEFAAKNADVGEAKTETDTLAFDSRRGSVAHEVAAAVAEAAGDLLVLGWTGQTRARWQRGRRMGLGSTARTLVDTAISPRILVVRRVLMEKPPVLVLWDGSAAAERGLAAATALARATGDGVAVLAFGPAAVDEGRIAPVLHRAAVPWRWQALPPLTVARLQRATDFPHAVLVLPVDTAMTLGLSTADVLDHLSCSVLLVR